MNKQDFYLWYDLKTHTAVFPIQNYKSMDFKNRLIWQLEQIGVELLENIDVPIDISAELRHGKLPDWLRLLPEDDEEDFLSSRIRDFLDEEERIRLRIIVFGIGMVSTHVMTRYFAHEFFAPGESIADRFPLPAVFDSQNCDDKDDKLSPIWVADKPCEYLQDIKLAEDWLDENFPCWRDPMRYWD